jgi:DNA-binding response OmpR family regulator
MVGKPTADSLQVTIVSANPETLDGLQTYLRRAGVDARGATQLRIDLKTGSHRRAVVVFPDDFPGEHVIREVARLRRQRPAILLVLVTCEPQRFEHELGASDGSPAPVIVPKPAWGWIILDALRGRTNPS